MYVSACSSRRASSACHDLFRLNAGIFLSTFSNSQLKKKKKNRNDETLKTITKRTTSGDVAIVVVLPVRDDYQAVKVGRAGKGRSCTQVSDTKSEEWTTADVRPSPTTPLWPTSHTTQCVRQYLQNFRVRCLLAFCGFIMTSKLQSTRP